MLKVPLKEIKKRVKARAKNSGLNKFKITFIAEEIKLPLTDTSRAEQYSVILWR